MKEVLPGMPWRAPLGLLENQVKEVQKVWMASLVYLVNLASLGPKEIKGENVQFAKQGKKEKRVILVKMDLMDHLETEVHLVEED